jgi:putative mycofactocin binding protein MftB
VSTDLIPPSLLPAALQLNPRVALRPEPFGALAYHFGTRRLVFLKHPDMVAVARALGRHRSLADALRGCSIDEARWPSFVSAFTALLEADVVVERARLRERRE